MTFYSTHLKPNAEPILVPERFAWGALVFGPLWLAAHCAWIPAVLAFVAGLLIVTLTHGGLAVLLMSGLAAILGLTGNDLRRWSLERRGYVLVHVFGGRDEIEAMQRLLVHRPDLEARYRPGVA
ncbi:MAG TPA: DUF2628 domain-containing protein [Rhodopila sp.]|uniref:DUF2628 domain-containing protein n=1 Tax=Rhodopila sp. TaxID=2480087 RepID=UPI002CAA2591|nr:DUF2628 domain-containing protein [Rhodopila sp.]HVY13701.1 DUF2628 domain-containing protein [Rhodopila sp.]